MCMTVTHSATMYNGTIARSVVRWSSVVEAPLSEQVVLPIKVVVHDRVAVECAVAGEAKEADVAHGLVKGSFLARGAEGSVGAGLFFLADAARPEVPCHPEKAH